MQILSELLSIILNDRKLNLPLKFNVKSIVFIPDIAANKNTTMLTELLMEVKQMSWDIQFLKTEITDLRSTLNSRGAEPDLQREENFPIVLPLTNEEQFDEAEAALKKETVHRKMVNNFYTKLFLYNLSRLQSFLQA